MVLNRHPRETLEYLELILGAYCQRDWKQPAVLTKMSSFSLDTKATNLTSCLKATGGCADKTRSCESVDDLLIVGMKQCKLLIRLRLILLWHIYTFHTTPYFITGKNYFPKLKKAASPQLFLKSSYWRTGTSSSLHIVLAQLESTVLNAG